MFESPKGRWEIVPVWRASNRDRRYDLFDRPSIEEFLRRHMFDFGVMVNLRDLLAPDAGRLTDNQIIESIAWKLANKELVIREALRRDVAPPGEGGGGGATKAEKRLAGTNIAPPADKAPPPKPKHWIKVKVVDNDTKKPVDGVRVEMDLPGLNDTSQNTSGGQPASWTDLNAGTAHLDKLSDANQVWEFIRLETS